MLKRIVFLTFVLSCVLGLALAGGAQAAIIYNGDFEYGNFNDWYSCGFVGLDWAGIPGNNVIAGSYSAELLTIPAGCGDCSYLAHEIVWPDYVPKAVNVSFKVRYKTDQDIYGYSPWDPFHAMLQTDSGSVSIVTISATGVTAAPRFSVRNLQTNTLLPPPPAEPPFFPALMWDYETPTLLVSGTIPYSSCYPVYIEFDICTNNDFYDVSGAWVDDVDITFVNDTSAGAGSRPGGSPILCP